MTDFRARSLNESFNKVPAVTLVFWIVKILTTTLIFSLALIAVFTWWYRSERTLSVHTIHTWRRELFYWAAILFTFSLGTSGGDLLSEQLGLGYAVALALFAAGIAVVYALYRFHVMNGVLAFWIAYILTRPLGASAGDLVTQPGSAGGLGIGRLVSTAVILVLIIALVAYLSAQERKHPPEPVTPSPPLAA